MHSNQALVRVFSLLLQSRGKPPSEAAPPPHPTVLLLLLSGFGPLLGRFSVFVHPSHISSIRVCAKECAEGGG